MCRKLLFLFVLTASSTQADMGVMVERIQVLWVGEAFLFLLLVEDVSLALYF